jgi:hypothetical protein
MINRRVTLVRTDRKTGKVARIPGTLRSDDNGVVFESSEGAEALRCSGLPETFQFESAAGLTPTPMLSVRVRSDRPVTAQVTLSYLTGGFDWAAHYTATLSADRHTLDLGAWLTLSSAVSVSFPDAQVAVVAGRVNYDWSPEGYGDGDKIWAECWPAGTTTASPSESVTVTGSRLHHGLEAEPLADLKLYRIPWASSVNAQQTKQLRLLDHEDVPVQLIHVADLTANEERSTATRRVLRTRNDSAHHLGIPLPGGRVDTFTGNADTPVLLEQAPLRDIAVGEELEIGAGKAPGVQVRTVDEKTASSSGTLPLLPGVVHLRHAVQDDVRRIEITNASNQDTLVEARLQLPYQTQLIRAEPAPVPRYGRQVLAARVPARGRVMMRYRTEHTADVSWMLAYTGKEVSDVIRDSRARALLQASAPAVAEDLLVRLAGPPHVVVVTQNRYVRLSGCAPWDCSYKGLLWVDTRTGEALGVLAYTGTGTGTLTLASNMSVGVDQIPERARQAVRAWMAGLTWAPGHVELADADGVARTLDAAAFAPLQ